MNSLYTERITTSLLQPRREKKKQTMNSHDRKKNHCKRSMTQLVGSYTQNHRIMVSIPGSGSAQCFSVKYFISCCFGSFSCKWVTQASHPGGWCDLDPLHTTRICLPALWVLGLKTIMLGGGGMVVDDDEEEKIIQTTKISI